MAGWEVSSWPENIESQISQTDSSWSEQADSAIVTLKEKALADLKNPRIQDLAKREYDEFIAAIEWHDEALDSVDGPRKEFEWDIKALKKIDSKFHKIDIPSWNTQAGLDNMVLYISWLQWENQESMYDALNSVSNRKLKKLFQKHGFINSETIQIFSSELWLDHSQWDLKRVELEISKEEKISENNIISESSFKSHRDIALELSSIPWVNEELMNTLSVFLKDWVIHTDIAHEEYTKFKEFFENLSDKPVIFAEVFDSLWGKDSDVYAEIKKFVLASSPWLKSSFETYEWEYTSPLPLIQKDVAKEVTRELNDEIIWDYDIAEDYDYSKNPPVRSIGLEWSEYKMKSQPPIGDFYPATVEYTNVTQEVQPKLDSVNAVMNYVSWLSPSANIEVVREQLNAMVPYTMKAALGITNIKRFSTIDELKTWVLNLAWLEKDKLEKKRADARKKYKESLNILKEAYKKTLRESQEKQQEILTFLKDIGFDKIPQDFTNRIIAQINITKNIDLWRGLQINSDIDIENWEFWVNILGDDTNLEREAFVRLMNLIVTWEAEWEHALIVDPASFISQKLIVDPRSIQYRLNKSDWIIGSGGSLDMGQVYKNLGWSWEKKEEEVST